MTGRCDGVNRSRLYSSAPMDFGLSEDQREIQALAREVAKEKIEPHAAERDRAHRFPRELFTELAALGLMGVCIPEEYGGAGARFVASIQIGRAPCRGRGEVAVGAAPLKEEEN